MSTEENKATVRRLIEEVWNQGNLAVFDELYAPNFIFHDPNLPHVRTREDDKRSITETLNAYPGLHMTSAHILASGDRADVRVPTRGTHTGDTMTPMPSPASGKPGTVTAFAISHLSH